MWFWNKVDGRDELIRILKERIELRDSIIASYKINVPKKKPYWLDSSKFPAHPIINIPRKGNTPEAVSIPVHDLFSVMPFFKELVKKKAWPLASREKTLDSIWEFVYKNVKYVSEPVENWQFPIVTLNRGCGDCEDSAILFVTLARACSIPEDEVFMCTGELPGGNHTIIAHAFPIAKLSTGWYIYDTTAPFKPDSPRRLDNSNYSVFSVSNDIFKGVPSSERF